MVAFRLVALIAFSIITVALSATAIAAAISGDRQTQQGEELPVRWTALIMRTPQAPILFRSGDGKYNLVYDVLVENYSNSAATVDQFQVLDDKDNDRVIQSLSGKALQDIFTIRGADKTNPGEIPQLAAGQMGVLWVNLVFNRKEDAPKQLLHRIKFLAKNSIGTLREYSYNGNAVTVSDIRPVVIGPPLKGGNWAVEGGYSSPLGHRRALFPINNNLYCAQRYAIDWLRLDKDNYAVKSPATKNESSNAYAQPIIAVADGTIISAIDRFSDQTPVESKGEDRVAYACGNSVTENIGHGHYVFYAHMKPDSVLVKPGQYVHRGEIIGLVGNSGNSFSPHLQIDVTDGPLSLESNSVPYVFDQFDVAGQIADTARVNDDINNGQPIPLVHFKGGTCTNELPQDGLVVKFPE